MIINKAYKNNEQFEIIIAKQHMCF